MHDLVIRDARVVDGTGADPVSADVAVSEGRIREIGACGPGRREIQAGGRLATPGFIDLHAHSDLQILARPDHTAKVSQGVTTEVLGQDGLSFAPVDEATRRQLLDQIAGWNGDVSGLDLSWDTVAGYLDRLDQGVACNAAYLVPQGTVRLLVVGDERRPATTQEQTRMERLVAAGLEEGAVGLSSGLTYTPGMFADQAELTGLCRVVASHGGYWCPHTRSYGAGALEAYAEAVRIATAAGCALHLTHAVMNFAPNRGRAGEFLDLVDDALAAGLDVTLDTYPYLPGSTTLSALLPSWVTGGGTDALLSRLRDPQTRRRVAHEMEHVGTDGCHGCVTEWDTVQISGVGHGELDSRVGETIAGLARQEGRPPAEVYLDLLIEDRLATTILQHVGDEANVRTIMQHPVHCGGSDAILVGARPHPRAWGTFPRFLGHYVRELGVLDLVDCVHHLTGRAARRLGLRDRGLVREGYAADLVVLDPDTIRDTATFEEPRQQADGIAWVLVNGTPVIEDGVRTDALPGRALRGPGGAR